MQKTKQEKEVVIHPDDLVTVTKMNHLTEILHMKKRNNSATIRKLDKDRFVVLSTGEIKEYEHINNRSESYNSLRQTFRKIGLIINNNFTGEKNELFVTLTYKENMTDNKQLYVDVKKFMMKMRYKYKKSTDIDYISIVEPQGRGAWHAHILMRFNSLNSVFEPKEELAEMWGHGTVTIQRLEKVDNIGIYLTAYLADVELTENTLSAAIREDRKIVEKEHDGEKKRFVKGGRLHLYPPGMNLYRKSKGIIIPERKKMTYKNAKKIVGSAKPHYSKRYDIENENFENTIQYEQYNSKRKSRQ